jgi:N-acylneuraminate cytidylyltransferase
VSTDDSEISEIAVKAGALVIDRPAELSDDEATTEQVLEHALRVMLEEYDLDPAILVLLQCTSPIRAPEDIDSAVSMVSSGSFDSVLSVSPSHRFIWRSEDNEAEAVNYDPLSRPRRQEMTSEFVENGSLYVFRPQSFREVGSRLHGKIGMHVMGPWSHIEIDSQEDFKLCEWVLSHQRCVPPNADALRRIKTVVLDFDGVMTDNRVIILQDGSEAVTCSRSDGMGIQQLVTEGVAALVLSTEANPVVQARCSKLGIPCIQNLGVNKAQAFREYLSENELSADDVLYLGNDINDLECMELAGLSVAVSDAHPAVLEIADWVLALGGGGGAVRELTDLVVQARQHFSDKLIE